MEALVASFGASTEVLAAQLSIPLELNEAICSICWAAPFLDNSSELMKIRSMLFEKYRNDDHLRQTTFVHKKVLLGLSHDMPADSLIEYYLSNILNEHEPLTSLPTPSSSTASVQPASSKPLSQSSTNTNTAPTSSLSRSELVGVLRVDALGHSWVLPNDDSQPVFISPNSRLSSQDSDSVLIQLDMRQDGKRSGQVIRCLTARSQPSPDAPPPLVHPITSAHSTPNRASFIGTVHGELKFDVNNHAWLISSQFDRSPIFIPPVALPSLRSDHVSAHVFDLHGKLVGILLPEAHSSSPNAPSSELTSSAAIEAGTSIPDNSLLRAINWSPTAQKEIQGVFKSEGDEFGLVLPEDSSIAPIVILGESHCLGARTGDQVVALIFGEATNPASGTTYSLAQILSHSTPPANLSSDLPSIEGLNSDSKRNPDLISADAGDFTATLELSESGNYRVLHPTLPWTYVNISHQNVGNAIPGDTVAVELDLSSSNRTQTGRLLGVVTALEGYSTTSSSHLSSVVSYSKVDSIEELEKDLHPLDEFISTTSLYSPPMSPLNPRDVVVIDFGSSCIKIGLANQPVPILSIPTLAGRIQDSLLPQRAASAVSYEKDLVVGNSALERRALLALSRPYDRGCIQDRSAVKSLLFKALGSVGVSAHRSAAILTESAAGSYRQNQATFAGILSEFGVDSAIFPHPGTCALLSERKRDGIVIDMGHTSTIISVIQNGDLVDGLSSSFPLSGVDVTNHLITLLAEDGYRMWKSESQKVALEEMKRAVSFVKPYASRDSHSPLLSSRAGTVDAAGSGVTYRLEDGMEIIVGDRAWQCMEILFDPTIVGLDCVGLPEFIMRTLLAVRSSESAVQDKHAVCDTLLLVGGTSMAPGLRQRIQTELHILERRNESEERPYIEQPPKSQFSVWIGASQLIRSSTFNSSLKSTN